MNVIYVTYDVDLKQHLKSLGIKDILYGLNPKSLKRFYVYERTEELEKSLKDWFRSKS